MFKPISGRAACLFAVFLVCACCASAQVIQVGGGTSTLYDSQGGSISLTAPTYDMTLGAGYTSGRFGPGFAFSKRTKLATYTFGSNNLGLALPTDIFSGSRYLLMTGGGFRTTRFNTEITAYAGMNATNLGSPLFDGFRTDEPAALLTLKRKIGDSWASTTDLLVTTRTTVLEGLEFSPSKDTNLAFSAGLGSGKPYGAASADIHRRWFDAKAAYIDASDEFHRIGIDSQYTSEPVHENAVLTVRPFRFMSITGGHQNYLVPLPHSTGSTTSQMNQLSSTAKLEKVTMTAGVYDSTYSGHENRSVMFTAGRDLTSRAAFQGTFIRSQTDDHRPMNLLVGTLRETLSPRWTTNQTVNNSNGNTTVTFGGSFLSNLFTASADYQTLYVPARIESPFQQTLVLNAQLFLFGRARIHAGTYVDPNGKLLYTGDVHFMLAHGANQPKPTHVTIGDYIVHGSVVDDAQRGIEGAALLLDNRQVFTDSKGYFIVRERKQRTHELKVLLDQFFDGRKYQLISAPETVTSTQGEGDPGVTVIVRLAPKKVIVADVPHVAGFDCPDNGTPNLKAGDPVKPVMPVVDRPTLADEFNKAMKDIQFEFDRSEITADQVPAIQAMAAFLQEHPDVVFTVEGHFDERGPEGYNLTLGAKRADAVKLALMVAGISGDRINTISFSSPICNEQSEECWRRNRRAHLAFGFYGKLFN